MTTGRILVTLLAVSSVCLATYNCRRNKQGCKNQGSCGSDGTCTCGDGTLYQGVDCGVVIAWINATACDASPCLNEGVCMWDGTNALCWCHPDYYGDQCRSKRFDVMCFGDRKILHANPYVSDSTDTFGGRIYIAGKSDQPSCIFQSRDVVAAADGFNPDWTAGYALVINDIDPLCGDITEIIDGTTVTYERLVKIEYEEFILTNLDEVLKADCIYTDTNDRTLEFPGTVQIAPVTDNLFTNTSTSSTYEPLVFAVSTDSTGDITGTQTLAIGTHVTFQFNIPAETGFVSLGVKTLAAGDGADVNFPIITERCQETAASNVIISWDKSADNRTVTIIINMFKFLSSDIVAFSGIVSICRADDTTACDPPTCTGSSPAARKRRASGDEKTINQVFNVVDDASKLPPSSGTGQGSDCPSTEQPSSVPQDCMLKAEILTVIIIMAAALVILMIACVILTYKILRRPLKVTEMYPEEHQSSVSLPRLSPANF